MNKITFMSLITLMAPHLVGCSQPYSEYDIHGPFVFKVPEKNKNGLHLIGQLKIKDLADRGTKITIKVKDLEPGVYPVKLHQIGSCSVPDLMSSGRHLDTINRTKNKLETDPHAPDKMTLVIDADGTGESELIFPYVSFTSKKFPTLSDENGTSLIIHAKEDDSTNKQDSSTGARIACALIPRPKKWTIKIQ